MVFLHFEFYFFLAAVALILSFTPRKFCPSVLLAASLLFYFRLTSIFSPVSWIIPILTLSLVFLWKHLKKHLVLLILTILWAGHKLIGAHDYHHFSSSLDTLHQNEVALLGLSFCFFRAVSLVEYLNTATENYSFFHSLLYMFYFPSFLGGPLIRPANFRAELKKKQTLNQKDFSEAIIRIVVGLFKKLVIADNLFVLVKIIYSEPYRFGYLSMLLATVLAMVYVYFDLGGYTDMAIGTSKLLGINLPENFNWPFRAKNIADFWRSFHVSVVTWFSSHVFFPLSRRFSSRKGIALSLLITTFAVGLWHMGDIWYLLWGVMVGMTFICEGLVRNWWGRFQKKKKINFSFPPFLIFIQVQFLIAFPYLISHSFRLISRDGLEKYLSLYKTPFLFSELWNYCSFVHDPYVIAVAFFCAVIYEIQGYYFDLERSFIKLHWLLKTAVLVVLLATLFVWGNFNGRLFNYLHY